MWEYDDKIIETTIDELHVGQRFRHVPPKDYELAGGYSKLTDKAQRTLLVEEDGKQVLKNYYILWIENTFSADEYISRNVTGTTPIEIFVRGSYKKNGRNNKVICEKW